MRQLTWFRFLMALAVIASMVAPATVLAAGFDVSPAYQAEIANPGNAAAAAGLAEVARIVRPMKGGGSAESLLGVPPSAVVEEPTPTPVVEEVEPTPVVEEATPVATPTPVAEEEVAPTPAAQDTTPPRIDYALVEMTQHSNEGVTIQAPSNWLVEPGEFGTVFNIEIPNTEFIGLLQPLGEQDFPGLLAVVLFQSQADAFVMAIDPGAALVGVSSLVTGQQLPMAKIALTADFEGEAGGGAMYLVSAGADTYGLFGFAPPEVWSEIEAGVDLMAQSIFFDPSLITLTKAENGPLEYTDPESGLRLILPENWQLAPTGDIDLPVVIADPEFQFAGMLGMAPGSPKDEGLDLDALLQSPDGDPDPEAVAAIVQTLLELMDIPSDEFMRDEALTQAFVEDGSAVVRFGGLASFEGMLDIPVMFYLALSEDTATALILLGAEEQVLASEPAILEIMNSVQRVE